MTILGFLISVNSNIGYPVLFLLVMAESSGIPIPGETALLVAAFLASSGKLQIEFVIALAAAAAIVGDNIGYLIGRKGGRWLLERPGRFERQRHQVLETGEPFFDKHGPKAVFFGRWVLGLRVWASWLAGATRMHWKKFVFWNALGGISWATTVGLIAYFVGHSAQNAITSFGLFGLVAAALAAVSGLLLHRRGRNARRLRASSAQTYPRASRGDADAPSAGEDQEERVAPRSGP